MDGYGGAFFIERAKSLLVIPSLRRFLMGSGDGVAAETGQQIRIKISAKSKAKKWWTFRFKKFIAGEKMEVSVSVKNQGAQAFPKVPLSFGVMIDWVPTQKVTMRLPMLSPGSMSPGEEKDLGAVTTHCMSGGWFALVYLGILPGMEAISPFTVTDVSGNPIIMSGSVSSSLQPDGTYLRLWHGHQWSNGSVHSFWVNHWNDIWGFYVFVLSAVTMLAAISAVIISFVLAS